MDFAVSAAIRAINKFSPVFSKMGADMGKFGSSAEGAFSKATQSAGLFKKLLGANILGNLVTGAIRQVTSGIRNLAREGLQLASDLIEVQNVVDTSFGAVGARKVDAWARSAIGAFGLSELQAKKFSGTMGAMLKSSGLAGGEIVEMSTRLSGLAGDFASFYNLPIEDAFQKIQSGISGEIEPLRRLGVNLSITNLQEYALSKGIRTKWQNMKQGDQIMLRYRYLLDKTADAQGDFAKTLATSYANQKRVLQTNLQQVTARALNIVLPLALRFTKHLNSIVDRIGQWVENNKELIASKVEGFVDKVTRALERAGPFLSNMLKAAGWLIKNWPFLAAVYVAWQIAQLALNGALSDNPIGAVILGIEALVVAVLMVIKYWDQITAALQSAWNWFNKLFGNPWIANAIYFLSTPIYLIISAIRTLIDLLSGRGWRSFENLIPPWAKGIGKMFGYKEGAQTGMWSTPEKPPNEGQPSFRFINQVNVDNSRAPGVTSTVRTAPPILGLAGANP